MKRQATLFLCLLMLLVILSGCSNEKSPTQNFTVATQAFGPTEAATATPDPQSIPQNDPSSNDPSIFASNPYDDALDNFTPEDVLNEEGYQDDGIYDSDTYDGYDSAGFVAGGFEEYAYAEETSTPYPYAGTSPIPLNPVDMPTPTPRPPLNFTFVPYTITSMGLTFDGPAGWVPNESVNGQFLLQESDMQLKDGQLGILTITSAPLTNDYSESNLKEEVMARYRNITDTDFSSLKPSLTATRHLMGHMGVYMNYTATRSDGTQIGGRIHCVSIDKTLYGIEIIYPLGFRDAFLEVFSQMRSSIKRIQ